MKSAEDWLQKGKDLTPTASELLLVQAFINIRQQNPSETQNVLSKLQEIAPGEFYTLAAWIDYYALVNKEREMSDSYIKATKLAMTTTRRAYLLNRMGRYYIWLKQYNKSIDCYRKLVQLTPSDPWMWHNMSIIYLAQNNLFQAWRCNNIALKIMNFEAAQKIRRNIIRRFVTLGLTGGLIAAGIMLRISIH